MPSAFIRRLSIGTRLGDADRAALTQAVHGVEIVPPHIDLIREGARPADVHIVLDGFACRYKLLDDGGRQILAWLTAGDCCDLQVSLLGEMDHSIATLSECRVGYVDRTRLDALVVERPQIMRALWRAMLVEQAMLHEWLTSMGRRSGEEQIAHLFCELLERLKAAGLAAGDAFEFPITQVELADTVGLSSVHVNRIIHNLRDQRLISWRGRAFQVLDAPRLRELADFSPNYLHLGRANEWKGSMRD